MIFIQFNKMDTKKILIIGSTGMLGQVVTKYFIKKYPAITYYTSRNKTNNSEKHIFLDILDKDNSINAINKLNPSIIINCAAVTKKGKEVKKRDMFYINSYFPHLLAENTDKLIQISTDGVFSGKRGKYSELDSPDPTDPLGISKFAGEIDYGNHLTIRTSVIGPEEKPKPGLLEWFLSQKGTIKGYDKAIWSGVTTYALAKIIDLAISSNIQGIVHIHGEAISKFDLLNIMKKVFNKNEIEIIPDSTIKCDRSLISKRKDFNPVVLSHEDMLKEIKSVTKEYFNRDI